MQEPAEIPTGEDHWLCRRVGEATVASPVVGANFVEDDERVILNNKTSSAARRDVLVERAGVRRRVFFQNPKVAMVTCGGLCPGLNSVIRGLVLVLWHRYGVRDIVGYKNGFEGLNRELSESISLTPQLVKHIHNRGGTILGTSRGPQDVQDMVRFLQEQKVDILFCIGGDGTLRGASAISEAASGVALSVIGIPKTIDNDIALIAKSFGFDSAVELAQAAIDAGHAEASSAKHGMAVVKLMGRYAGHIAVYASLASGDVNVVLIPEAETNAEVLVEHVRQRLLERGHALIVVAEGACQDMLVAGGTRKDKSGNTHCNIDVAVYVKELLNKELRDLDPTIKLIDPSYTIRAAPANPSDQVLCLTLAQMSVHAAMAGITAACVGYAAGHFCLIPLDKIAAEPSKKVDVHSAVYQTMLDATGMPRFPEAKEPNACSKVK